MKHTNYVVAVAVFAIASSLAVFAGSKTSHSVTIGDSVTVGSTQLKAGSYRLQWEGDGPNVQVNFVRDGKTVATLPATFSANNPKVTQDQVLTDHSGTAGSALVEIDFARQKESLVFGQNGM